MKISIDIGPTELDGEQKIIHDTKLLNKRPNQPPIQTDALFLHP
jgi:hypothetical protein